MVVSERLRLLAEEPDAHQPEPPPPSRRIVTPSYFLGFGPSQAFSTVSAVRTTEGELDEVVAEVRQACREAGYTRTTWFVGPSSRPGNLADLLERRGFLPATSPPHEPVFTAMALTEAPPAPPPGIEARLVGDVDEYVQGIKIAMEAFGEPPDVTAEWVAAAPQQWLGFDGVTRFAHMAYVDGRPVGYAFTVSCGDALLLGGAAVLADARGRGAYRSLLAARWARAVELGSQGLVIHAGEMSRPILERCGFQRVCLVKLLDDPEAARPSAAGA